MVIMKRKPTCHTVAQEGEFTVDSAAITAAMKSLGRAQGLMYKPSKGTEEKKQPKVTLRAVGGLLKLSISDKTNTSAHALVQSAVKRPDRDQAFTAAITFDRLQRIAKECPGWLALSPVNEMLVIRHDEVGAQGASIKSEFKAYNWDDQIARDVDSDTADIILSIPAASLIDSIKLARPIDQRDSRYTSELVLAVDDAATQTVRISATDGRQLLRRSHVQAEYGKAFDTIVIPRRLIDCLDSEEVVQIRKKGETTFLLVSDLIYSFGQQADAAPTESIVPKECENAFMVDRDLIEQACVEVKAAWDKSLGKQPLMLINVGGAGVSFESAKNDGTVRRSLKAQIIGDGSYVVDAARLQAMLKALPKTAKRVIVAKAADKGEGEQIQSGPATITAEGHHQIRYVMMPCKLN